MTYEPKDMTGALFANKDRKSDKHANATGSCLIDGVAYFVDAWTNQDRNGNRYQSLKFKRKDGQSTRQGMYDRDEREPDSDDSEIPF